jgi:predicted Zn finger-like uncharacterized protein
MIITCASCLTKFSLDDSRIPANGVKVRCSRCKHLFFVVPPPETKEEIIENVESFAKYHEKLMEPGEEKVEVPQEAKVERGEEALEEREKEEIAPEEKETEEVVPEEKEEEGAFLFSEKAPALEKAEKPAPPEKAETLTPPEEVEKFPREEPVREGRVESRPFKPRSMIRAEKKGPSRFFALVVVLALLILGVFYVWSELSSGGRLSPYFESPVKKVTEFWDQIWGTERGDLTVGDLSGYEEKIGELPLFIIEGKVKNESKFTKKHIKIRVIIFDQDKLKVGEKEAICGRIIGRGELKKQPVEFFKGEMVIQPQTEQEMITPSGMATPFMVIFKDPPIQAKEFKVEIVEAPNL